MKSQDYHSAVYVSAYQASKDNVMLLWRMNKGLLIDNVYTYSHRLCVQLAYIEQCSQTSHQRVWLQPQHQPSRQNQEWKTRI